MKRSVKGRISVTYVVRYYRQREDYHAEFAKGAGVVDQNCSEEAAGSGGSVSLLITVVTVVQSGG